MINLIIVFKPGTELQFHYGAQISTGIPNSGSQVGGFAINTTVKVQFIKHEKVIVYVSFLKIISVIIELSIIFFCDHNILYNNYKIVIQ